MMKKFNYIQLLTGLYIVSVALYMLFNDFTNKHDADFWKNYYWIVNKSAMLMALMFNYKKDKTIEEWFFINFLTIQTACLIIYFSLGLPYYYEWMKKNDAIIYSFFIGGFLAVIALWMRKKGIFNRYSYYLIPIRKKKPL